jgi:hypothetical protein
MSKGGAPFGNQNALRGRIWTQAIERALARRKAKSDQIKAIDELADKLLDTCASGDLPALKELGDRLEGKAIQSSEISGPGGGPVPVQQWQLQPVKPAPRPEREQRRKG